MSHFKSSDMKNVLLSFFCLLLLGSLSAQNPRDHRTNAGWTIIASNAKDVTVNASGVIFMVSGNGSLAEYTRPGWNYDYAHKLTTYSESGSMAVKVLTNGNMLKKDANTSSPGWKAMPGSDAVDLCVAMYTNRNTATFGMIMVNTAGKIYGMPSWGTSWEQFPGSDAARVSVGNMEIWLVNTVGKVYRYRQGGSNRGWDQMPGSNAADIAIAEDGSRWLTTKDGKLYRWYGSDWAEQKDITGVSRVDANNGHVAVVTKTGSVLYRSY